MTAALVLLCALLFALGGLVRDGTPSLGTTHGARALGAFLCSLGALVVAYGDIKTAGLVFGGILAGFYTDTKHGEGQQARGWADAGWLAVSGVTSLLPIAAIGIGFVTPWLAIFPLLGCAKIPIWFACWRIFPADTVSFSQPTRVAALVFGFVVGCAFALTL